MDVDAAYAAYEEITAEEWETFCSEQPLSDSGVKAGADYLGNFTDKLTNGMILGPTSKLCHLIWGKLSDDDRLPYVVEAKNAAPAPKKAKKAKKAVVEEVVEEVVEDDSESEEEDEATEYELADGTTVYVDSEWNAYNEDCKELGVVNPKTKTLTPKDG